MIISHIQIFTWILNLTQVCVQLKTELILVMGSLWLGSDQWPATHQFKTVTISAGCPLEWGAAVAARISMNIYWKHTLPSSLPVTDWLDIIFWNILCFDLCLFHVFLIQITWDLINIGPHLTGGLFWWDSGVWRYLYCVWDKTYRNTNSNETTNIERVLHYCWREHAPSNKVVRGTLWHPWNKATYHHCVLYIVFILKV